MESNYKVTITPDNDWQVEDKRTGNIVCFVPGDVSDMTRVVRALQLADLMAAVKTLGY
jgi:hypothetical protein